VPVAAPAIANAVFALTGRRPRSLPIRIQPAPGAEPGTAIPPAMRLPPAGAPRESPGTKRRLLR
jgi:hypothetical protein